MIVIPPLTLTTSMLSSSSVSEPDTTYDLGASAWTSGSGYAVNDYVYRTTTHKIYQCIVAVTAASAASTALPESNVLVGLNGVKYWAEVRPTNRWAMFDVYRNTKTYASTSITVSVVLGQRFDAIALLDLENVTSVIVTVVHSTGTATVVNQSVSGDSVIKFGFPPYFSPTATVTLSGTGVLGVGACVFGIYENIGYIQRNIDTDFINMSTVSRDIYGNATLNQKRSIPTIRANVMFDPKQIDRIAALRTSLNAIPAVWSGLDDSTTDNYYDSLLVLGFYKRFALNIDNPITVVANLELEEI